jgi:uncharacterized protein YciI
MASKHFTVQLTFPRGAPEPDERDAQREFLKGLLEEGTLRLAGVFTDERGGGLAILRADSLDDARATYDRSPLVQAGRVDLDVRELNVTWGNEST